MDCRGSGQRLVTWRALSVRFLWKGGLAVEGVVLGLAGKHLVVERADDGVAWYFFERLAPLFFDAPLPLFFGCEPAVVFVERKAVVFAVVAQEVVFVGERGKALLECDFGE